MTVPFVCVLIAFLQIYFPRIFVIAAAAKLPGGYDNRHPRDQQAALEGWGRRAQAAHLNAIEAFPPFAAAVIIAHLAHADPGWSARLAIGFVVLRTAYPFIYMANLDKLRTTVWTFGFLTAAALFVLPWLMPASG